MTETIYQASWFETKRHRKPHTTMYFMTIEETEWIFNTKDYLNGLAKVELIKIDISSQEYSMALSTHEKYLKENMFI